MRVIILGGNHKSNRDWVHSLSEYFTETFDVVTMDYSHWSEPDETINIQLELSKLRNLVDSDQKYVLIAKSAGTLLAMQAAASNILQPLQCVFIGLPVTFASEQHINLKGLLAKHSVPSLLLQNSHDPIGSFSHVDSLVGSSGSGSFILQRLEGDDHDYEDHATIAKYVNKFISVGE